MSKNIKKSESDNTSNKIIRDESNLRNASNMTPTIAFLLLIIIAVSCIVTIVSHFKGDTDLMTKSVVVIVISSILSIIIDKVYNWFINLTVEIKGDRLVFSYNRSGFSVGDSRTVVSIREIRSYKVINNGNKIKIKGEVEKKIPMAKPIIKKEITMPFDFSNEQKYKIIDILEQMKELRSK